MGKKPRKVVKKGNERWTYEEFLTKLLSILFEMEHIRSEKALEKGTSPDNVEIIIKVSELKNTLQGERKQITRRSEKPISDTTLHRFLKLPITQRYLLPKLDKKGEHKRGLYKINYRYVNEIKKRSDIFALEKINIDEIIRFPTGVTFYGLKDLTSEDQKRLEELNNKYLELGYELTLLQLEILKRNANSYLKEIYNSDLQPITKRFFSFLFFKLIERYLLLLHPIEDLYACSREASGYFQKKINGIQKEIIESLEELMSPKTFGGMFLLEIIKEYYPDYDSEEMGIFIRKHKTEIIQINNYISKNILSDQKKLEGSSPILRSEKGLDEGYCYLCSIKLSPGQLVRYGEEGCPHQQSFYQIFDNILIAVNTMIDIDNETYVVSNSFTNFKDYVRSERRTVVDVLLDDIEKPELPNIDEVLDQAT